MGKRLWSVMLAANGGRQFQAGIPREHLLGVPIGLSTHSLSGSCCNKGKPMFGESFTWPKLVRQTPQRRGGTFAD